MIETGTKELRLKKCCRAMMLVFVMLVFVCCSSGPSAEYMHYIEHAKEMIESGDYEGAQAELDEAVVLEPDIPEAYMLRGYLFMSMGDLKAAGGDFAVVENKIDDFLDDENMFQAYLNIGNYKYQTGDFDGAIKAFEAVEDEGMGDSELYNAFGLAYVAKGDLDKGKAYYSQAIDEDPSNFYAYGNLAALFLDSGKPEVALNEINTAMNINPYVPQFFIVKAQILEALDDADGAIEVYTSAIDLWEGFGDAHYLRADAYMMSGDYLNAVKDFSDAKDYGILEGVLGMGIAYQGLGQFEDSINAFTEYLIQLEAIDLRALYHMAVSYYQLGNDDEVINTIDELLNYEPKDTEALMLKALAYERKLRHDQSIEILEDILDIDPMHEEASDMLEKLQGN